MAIYIGFSHEKWRFSIAMLVYQRVKTMNLGISVIKNYDLTNRHHRYRDNGWIWGWVKTSGTSQMWIGHLPYVLVWTAGCMRGMINSHIRRENIFNFKTFCVWSGQLLICGRLIVHWLSCLPSWSISVFCSSFQIVLANSFRLILTSHDLPRTFLSNVIKR